MPTHNKTASADRRQSRARITSDNVRRLREERGYSTDDLIAKMNELGYNRNRTTLFNVEHDMRRLQANEAVDMLTALGLDPYRDMPRLMCPEKRVLAIELGETHRRATRKLIQTARDYMTALTAYERILDDLKTETADDGPQVESQIESVHMNHAATVKLVVAELNNRR